MTPIHLKHILTTTRQNKSIIEPHTKCGCYYCQKIFYGDAITQYDKNNTAHCPYCMQDTVIPQSKLSGTITTQLLKTIYDKTITDKKGSLSQ